MPAPNRSDDPMAQPKQTGQARLRSCEDRSLVRLHAALCKLLHAEDAGPATETRCGDEEDDDEGED